MKRLGADEIAEHDDTLHTEALAEQRGLTGPAPPRVASGGVVAARLLSNHCTCSWRPSTVSSARSVRTLRVGAKRHRVAEDGQPAVALPVGPNRPRDALAGLREAALVGLAAAGVMVRVRSRASRAPLTRR